MRSARNSTPRRRAAQVKPSGALKPADPKVESVVDEIKAAAGITKPAALPLTAAAAAAAKAAESAEVTAPAVSKAPVKAAAAPKKIKAPTESKVDAAEIEPVKPARKPKAAKAIEISGTSRSHRAGQEAGGEEDDGGTGRNDHCCRGDDCRRCAGEEGRAVAAGQVAGAG